MGNHGKSTKCQGESRWPWSFFSGKKKARLFQTSFWRMYWCPNFGRMIAHQIRWVTTTSWAKIMEKGDQSEMKSSKMGFSKSSKIAENRGKHLRDQTNHPKSSKSSKIIQQIQMIQVIQSPPRSRVGQSIPQLQGTQSFETFKARQLWSACMGWPLKGRIIFNKHQE